MSLLSRLAVQAARAYGILSSDKNRVSADYLVVAGGGGGASGGGGAGAGGMLTSTATLSTLNTYSITVGAGGLGGVAGGVSNGYNGSNSVISGTGLSTITAIGGGGTITGPSGGGGSDGGSGGGGGGNDFGANSPAGLGTSGQGNNGGASSSTAQRGAGGGGGAGAVGGTGTTTAGGNGGNGLSSSISGSSVTYAGGGGGGSYSPNATTGGSGGTGGGGAGTGNGTTNATSGTANLGGGGGGGGATSGVGYGNGGNGGSGIVIISYTSTTPKFVGGTITTSGGNQIHTFTSSGTLSPITPITASYLVVAGGGSGGSGAAGGGGAGGLLTSSTTLYSGATYVVTVGAGGAGISTNTTRGNNGSNSSLSGTGLTTITSIGGGGGTGQSTSGNGQDGGSGGGGSRNNLSGGTGTAGQGNNGGSGTNSANYGGGGGGGAGAAGSNGTTTNGGNGGIGVQSSISGTATYYAGGGGGGMGLSGTPGTGGLGGGTNGSVDPNGTANATPNTGGGSGGAGSSAAVYNSGNGGSGIVIISYAGSQVFNGGLVTSSGGNTIHTFTSTGALTPLTNNLNNSLRFRSSASAYLSKTPTLAGNRKTWTFSAWVKRGTLGSAAQCLLGAGTSSTVYDRISFESDSIRIVFNNGTYDVNTSSVYRDPSAWYHIVVAMDTTQATAANRTKIYVNGNQLTAFATASYPAQNHETNINNSIANSIGALYAGSWGTYLDGYMTDINFIDGQALEPYYFGNNDANGVWKPIQYRGTYGTNGFYLTFGNTTSTTTLGYDSSPNGNNWTCNNISLTAGTTYDAMLDVPTNTSATVANYAVLNPLWKGSVLTLAGANLNVTSSGLTGSALSTIAMESGKYYCEVRLNSSTDATIIGIAISSFNPTTSNLSGAGGVGYYVSNGDKFVNGTQTAYGASCASGDIVGIAVDITAGTITFYKNNVSQGAITHGLTGPFYFATSDVSSTSNIDQSWNFGQRPFQYSAPSGFLPLNTYNLPTPTILQGNKYMDATLWTGNGATSNVIVNAGQFKPDFVWVKSRSAVKYNILTDSVRGTNSQLFSNDTLAQETRTDRLTAFNSNGFSLGNWNDVNNTSETYVGWQWQAGQGSTSSNTSGSITSTVSVNTTAGFSVVTYTGTGSTKTFGHGLGVTPAMFIVKSRSQTGENWVTWHKSFSNTAQGNMALNTTDAVSNSASVWGNTAPTSTLITVGNAAVNNNTSTYVAYCWADVSGYSKAFSYTGNGSSDGPMVYLGFRPKFIMIKRTDTTGSWAIEDTARDSYNQAITALYPNQSIAETTIYDYRDFLSNGFKLRTSDSNTNASGGIYIGMAFAEHPFKNSNAR